MAFARLPFPLSLLEDEIAACVEDTTKIRNRLTTLQEALAFPHRALKLFKQIKTTVLLIANPSVERTLHQRMLEESDCIVETVDTIADSLAILERGFDLVLFDFNQENLKDLPLLKPYQENSVLHLVALTNNEQHSLGTDEVSTFLKKPLDTLLIRKLLLQLNSNSSDEEVLDAGL
jgi:CheY-like chemotaxis protein